MKTWHTGKDPLKMRKQTVGFLETEHPNRGSRKNKCPVPECTWGVYGTTRKPVCEGEGEGRGSFREMMEKDGWERPRDGTRSLGPWRPQ